MITAEKVAGYLGITEKDLAFLVAAVSTGGQFSGEPGPGVAMWVEILRLRDENAKLLACVQALLDPALRHDHACGYVNPFDNCDYCATLEKARQILEGCADAT